MITRTLQRRASIETAPDLGLRATLSQATQTQATSGERGHEHLRVELITTFADLHGLSAAWESLYLRSGTTNPFTNPAWLQTWASYYVDERDLFVLAVFRGDRLVGVGPFHWVRLGPFGRGSLRALHLLGNGRSSQFTEIPGLLAETDEHRSVLRTVVAFLQAEAPSWSWTKLGIDAQQGWFEPQWLSKTTRAQSPFVVHHATRACVILDLPDSWEAFLAERKRNVRESIRRSFNRLDKRVGKWSVELPTSRSQVITTLEQILELHEARSQMSGKPKHPTMFERPDTFDFYRDAIVQMVLQGQAEVSALNFDGEVVAGLVALRANSRVFTSVTGARPSAWDFGPGTILIAELARREIDRGTSGINLSCGPNQSKLRWSERLEFNHDFIIVGPTRRARATYGLFAQASTLANANRMKGWNTYE